MGAHAGLEPQSASRTIGNLLSALRLKSPQQRHIHGCAPCYAKFCRDLHQYAPPVLQNRGCIMPPLCYSKHIYFILMWEMTSHVRDTDRIRYSQNLLLLQTTFLITYHKKSIQSNKQLFFGDRHCVACNCNLKNDAHTR